MKKQVYILNHTHWDREWYKTSFQLNVKLKHGLMNLIDDIENNKIKYFYLDGQLALIEDAREMLSDEYFAKLISLIKKEKIGVGPLFTMPDEFMPTAQTFIENIKYAREYAKKLEIPLANILHLPDMFGHLSQIPQIANMFGFDGIVAHRGINISDVYVNWNYSEYSAKLMALPRLTGYYNPFMNEDNFIEEVNKFIIETKDNFKDEPMVIFSGADHLFINGEFSEKVSKYNAQSEEYELVEISIFDLTRIIKESKPTKSINGLQNDNSKMLILADVWSSRIDSKMANRKAENALYNTYDTYSLFNNVDSKIVNRSIRDLLLNASHDTIYGCSVDGVNDNMLVRSKSIRESILDDITLNTWNTEKTKHIEFQEYLDVYSPVITAGKRIINARVFMPTHKEKATPFKLFDGDKEIKFIVKREFEREELISDLYVVNYFPRRFYEIQFIDHFEGLSRKQYRIVKTDNFEQFNNSNEFNVSNDQLFFKGQNVSLEGLSFMIEEDNGDTYNFAFNGERKLETLKLEKASEVSTSEAIVAEVFATSSFDVSLKIKATYLKQIDSITFELILSNSSSKNFRLLSRIQKANKDTWKSNIPFDVVENTKKLFKADFKVEAPQTYPQSSSYVEIEDKNIHHNAMYQFGIDFDGKGEFYSLVLMRSVDIISKQKLSTRNIGAGPWIKTPSARMLGVQTLNFAISPISNTLLHNDIIDDSLYIQTNVVKDNETFLTIDNENIVKSRITKTEATLFNISEFAQTVKVLNQTITFKPKEIKVIKL